LIFNIHTMNKQSNIFQVELLKMVVTVAIQLLFDGAIRPFDDLHNDRRPTWCGLLQCSPNKPSCTRAAATICPRPSPPPVGA